MNGWIRVKDAQELGEGALVELRPCGFCGKTQRFMLLRRVTPTLGLGLTPAGDFQASSASWIIAPGICLNPNRPFDPLVAIADGRLWRRADADAWDKRQGQKRDIAVDDDALVGVPSIRP